MSPSLPAVRTMPRYFEIEVRIKGAAYGRGKGPSKQVAEQIAAQTALESLGISN